MPKIDYSPKALEKLRSPEQLDVLMRVVSPKGWLLLVGSVLLTTALMVWAFLDDIPVKVHGVGILLYRGDLNSVMSQAKGVLSKLYVVDGQVVKAGDLLASIDVPELASEIQVMTNELQTLKRFTKSTDNFRMQKLEGELQILSDRYALETAVKAPVDGIVMEILISPIAEVKVGTPIVVLSPMGNDKKDLVAHIFIDGSVGKQISAGMVAQISPITVSPQSHGYMLGNVSFVALLPTAKAAILSLLKIGNIADYVEKNVKNPLYVMIDPKIDPNSITGYKWTSKGPRHAIQPGIFTSVDIIIEHRRPIEYLFPFLQRHSGGV